MSLLPSVPGLRTARRLTTAVLLLGLALVQCGPPAPKVPPVPADCSGLCGRLRQMKCELAEDVPETGTTCESWCGKYGAKGRDHGVDVECLAQAPTCAAADKCTY